MESSLREMRQRNVTENLLETQYGPVSSFTGLFFKKKKSQDDGKEPKKKISH